MGEADSGETGHKDARTVVSRQDGEEEEHLRVLGRRAQHERDGGLGGSLVVGDGRGEVVVAHGLAVVGEVKARQSQHAPHDEVAVEAHLHHCVAVEFPYHLFDMSV